MQVEFSVGKYIWNCFLKNYFQVYCNYSHFMPVIGPLCQFCQDIDLWLSFRFLIYLEHFGQSRDLLVPQILYYPYPLHATPLVHYPAGLRMCCLFPWNVGGNCHYHLWISTLASPSVQIFSHLHCQLLSPFPREYFQISVVPMAFFWPVRHHSRLSFYKIGKAFC